MKLRQLAAVAAVALVSAPSAAALDVDARAYFVQNATTGEVLAAQRARDRLPIASITKLMTVEVALGHARPSEIVAVAPAATGIPGSTVHLRPGERLSVGDLVGAALIQSANDAANALALHVGRGSLARFVRLMNQRARELGLKDTHFVRAEGLDATGHFSSARDATVLARVAMQRPLVRRLVRLRSTAIGGGRRLHTWNDLLATFPRVIGVKTGHTSGAGWSQVAAAQGRGFTIYATILGSPSRGGRNEDLAELLKWGLSRYRVVRAVDASRVYAVAATEYGRPAVPLVARRSLLRVTRVGRSLIEEVVVPGEVTLPVTRGQRLGEVRVLDGRRVLARAPLVAARGVERPGVAARVRWYATRTAERMWGWLT